MSYIVHRDICRHPPGLLGNPPAPWRRVKAKDPAGGHYWFASFLKARRLMHFLLPPITRTTRTVRPVQNFFFHRFCGVVNMQCGDVNKTSADALTKTTAHVDEMSIDGQIGDCEVSTNSIFDTVRISVTPIFLRCQSKC